MADIYRAKESFAFTNKEGLPRIVTAGSLMELDDPDFKGKEHLFEPAETATARGKRVRAGDSSAVETATSAPGEKRSVSTMTRGPGRPRKMVSEPPKSEDKEKDNG